MLAAGLREPYSEQVTIGTQFQLTPSLAASVDVAHLLGLHQYSLTELDPSVDSTPDTRILNPVLDSYFHCQATDGVPATCIPGVRHRLLRAPATGSSNRSRYDGLALQVQRRFTKRFELHAWYLLSVAKTYGGGQSFDDILAFSQGAGPGLTPTQSALQGLVQPQNFGYTAEDERHRFVFDGILELPHAVVISSIVQLASARPYTMYAGDDINGDGVPNDYYSPRVSDNPVFNPLGEGDVRFAVRPNSLRGTPFFQVDMRVGKTLRLRENATISFFAEMFNVTNRVNFGNDFVQSSDGFGLAQIPVPVLGTGINGPEVSQLPRKPVGLADSPFHAQIGIRAEF
jgi:hypothetical protein